MSKHTQRGRHRAAAFHQSMSYETLKNKIDDYFKRTTPRQIVEKLYGLGVPFDFSTDLHPVTGEPLDEE